VKSQLTHYTVTSPVPTSGAFLDDEAATSPHYLSSGKTARYLPKHMAITSGHAIYGP
jgi:hypothetical protein